jgi:hypothetical protein
MGTTSKEYKSRQTGLANRIGERDASASRYVFSKSVRRIKYRPAYARPLAEWGKGFGKMVLASGMRELPGMRLQIECGRVLYRPAYARPLAEWGMGLGKWFWRAGRVSFPVCDSRLNRAMCCTGRLTPGRSPNGEWD